MLLNDTGPDGSKNWVGFLFVEWQWVICEKRKLVFGFDTVVVRV
jgi:hypothetical protein